MKTVGTRREPRLVGQATGEALSAGARFSETLSHWAPSTFIPTASIASNGTKTRTNTKKTAWPAEWGCWPQSEVVSESTSRPATLEDLKSLLSLLNAHNVDYLLIGGYALAAHGYQRATTDIGLEGLLLTKQTLREKDVADWVVLERALEFMKHPSSDENS
jgi:hypothetical protein